MRSFSLEVALQGCLPGRRVSDPGNGSSFLSCLPGWPALGWPVGLEAGRKVCDPCRLPPWEEALLGGCTLDDQCWGRGPLPREMVRATGV